MTISIIIPAHNEERYISLCLESIMAQTVLPDEIIVVDNNCDDCTVDIASRYPVKVVHEKRRGIIVARNAGFNAAGSEIIARTDADTILAPDWISRVKERFASAQIDALVGVAGLYDLPFSTVRLDVIMDVYQGIMGLFQ